MSCEGVNEHSKSCSMVKVLNRSDQSIQCWPKCFKGQLLLCLSWEWTSNKAHTHTHHGGLRGNKCLLFDIDRCLADTRRRAQVVLMRKGTTSRWGLEPSENEKDSSRVCAHHLMRWPTTMRVPCARWIWESVNWMKSGEYNYSIVHYPRKSRLC